MTEQKQSQNSNSDIKYKVLYPVIKKIYPHDEKAYTQGMYYKNGYLYESTGLYGESTLRKNDILTGNSLKRINLLPIYFGEGITIYNDKIYQLTWTNKKGFVYDMNSFQKIGEFVYPTEGWGITSDGKSLIVSDGTNFLTFYNPVTFEITKTISVQFQNQSVMNLNELEFVDGKIYANVYMTDKIAIINSENGNVEQWIDISSLRMQLDDPSAAEVSNGIAFNPETKTFYLTGKYWSNLFEVVFEEK
ncbi:MAG: glutaminyl-peptide cyclotransferase [Candidatus Kapaibacteriota bacterium]